MGSCVKIAHNNEPIANRRDSFPASVLLGSPRGQCSLRRGSPYTVRSIGEVRTLSAPVKRSVAILVRQGEAFLSTCRADDDDELPGVWGLPAGSYRGAESLDELILRIGRDKLGVSLRPLRKLASGRQSRERYILEMELWEAEMSGVPQHPEWRWATAPVLEPGAAQGSFCCRLALDAFKN